MIPQISISSALGRLSVRSTPAEFRTGVETVELKLQNADGGRLRIHTTQAQVRIDQTEAFASAGNKKPMRQIMDYGKQCKQAAIDVIGTIAAEGKEFVRIERGGNPIVSQAKRLGYEDVRLTVKALPSVRPDIRFEMGTVEIRANAEPLQTQWQPVRKEGYYAAAKVRVEWLERPRLEISLEPGVELSFPDRSVGRAVNLAV